MSDTDKFHDRAMAVIEEVFGGEHHVFSLKWTGDACRFLIHESVATYDCSRLTRLVVSCHDHCVRGEIRNGGPRMLRVILSPRERTHKRPDCRAHPTMDQHLAHIRSGAPNYQPLFNQLRAEEPERTLSARLDLADAEQRGYRRGVEDGRIEADVKKANSHLFQARAEVVKKRFWWKVDAKERMSTFCYLINKAFHGAQGIARVEIRQRLERLKEGSAS